MKNEQEEVGGSAVRLSLSLSLSPILERVPTS